MISVRCPKCHVVLDIADDFPGQTKKCIKCGWLVSVPASDPTTEPYVMPIWLDEVGENGSNGETRTSGPVVGADMQPIEPPGFKIFLASLVILMIVFVLSIIGYVSVYGESSKSPPPKTSPANPLDGMLEAVQSTNKLVDPPTERTIPNAPAPTKTTPTMPARKSGPYVVPRNELASITCEIDDSDSRTWINGVFSARIHNGSNWHVTDVMVRIKAYDQDGNLLWLKEFNQPTALLPRTSEKTSIYTGKVQFSYYTVTVVQALGRQQR